MQSLELLSGATLTPDDSYLLRLVPELCAEGGILFGGWAMAAMVEVAQAWSGRRVRALAASFLAPARLGNELRLTVTSLRSGGRLAHCRVDGHAGGVLVLSAVVVTSPGTARPPRGWATVPSVQPPELCRERSYRFRTRGSAMDLLDVRLASPEPSPGVGPGGRSLLWARLLAPVSPEATLALLSDHVPYLVVRSIPGVRHATSVSASIRITGAAETPWTLLDVELTSADGVYCVGHLRQWSQHGAMAATADQTVRTLFGQGQGSMTLPLLLYKDSVIAFRNCVGAGTPCAQRRAATGWIPRRRVAA
jgi:acyl-CoA thioesterase